MRIALLVLLLTGCVLAGSVAQYRTSGLMEVWTVLPSCSQDANDTCGPVDVSNAVNFSLSFNGKLLTSRDTAIIDSAFQVRLMMSNESNARSLLKLSSSDSLLRMFGVDSINTRTYGASKGLTLDSHPYLWVIFKRWDTNAEVLDFKKPNTGLRDSAVMTISIKKERK